MSSFANLIAKWHDLGVTICRVFGEIWSIQTQSFQHLCDNESRAYEVWIGVINPSHSLADCRTHQRSESVVVLTEMAKIALPLLDREPSNIVPVRVCPIDSSHAKSRDRNH